MTRSRFSYRADEMHDNAVHGYVAMSAEQIKALMRSAIRDEFIACGILAATDEQKAEMQEDFSFLRRIRRTWERTVTRVGSAVIIGALSVLAAMTMLGFNTKYGK